jgi:hypothetical protein
MQRLIDTATSFYGAGNVATHKLLEVGQGPYSGRKMLLYSESASTIKFCYSDPPYSNWSDPVTIASDAADYPATGIIDSSGDIFVAYTKANALELVCRRLQFAAGSWAVEDEVVVYSDQDNFFPSLIKDSSGRLHLSWTSYDSPESKYYIHSKYSTNDGVSWGGGAADPGDLLTSGSSGCSSALLCIGSYVYCFFTDGGTSLAYRTKADGAALWGGAVTLYQGSNLDDALSVAVSQNGSLIGVAFKADSKLLFLEYDLQNWSSVFEIASSFSTQPLLMFNGAIPVVIYGVIVGDEQTAVRYRRKNGSGFDPESSLHQELEPFSSVMLYDADGSPLWQSLTSQAANSNPADVFHPVSGKFVQAVGDAVYLGGAERFASIRIELSTAGDAGGGVIWQYYDGSQWQAFTPETGAYAFDENSTLVRLWVDAASSPTDWQKLEINGHACYWIKAEVTSAFATSPVGSQLTPLTDIKHINR